MTQGTGHSTFLAEATRPLKLLTFVHYRLKKPSIILTTCHLQFGYIRDIIGTRTHKHI